MGWARKRGRARRRRRCRDWPGARPSCRSGLEDEPTEAVTIEILDASGRHVRSLSSAAAEAVGFTDRTDREQKAADEAALPKGAGVQRGVWDLRYDGARLIMDAKLDWGDPSVGPRAVPGVYTVRLTAAGRTLERKVTITPDPRSTVSQADLEAQLALALGIRDDVSRLTDMVESLRSLRQQLQDRIETLADDDRAAALVRDSKALVERLDAHENEMHNPTAEVACDILAMKGGARLYSRLSPLAGWIAEAGGAPTQGMREVYAAQKQELDGYASRFDGLLSVDLAGLNRQAQSLGIGYVVIR